MAVTEEVLLRVKAMGGSGLPKESTIRGLGALGMRRGVGQRATCAFGKERYKLSSLAF